MANTVRVNNKKAGLIQLNATVNKAQQTFNLVPGFNDVPSELFAAALAAKSPTSDGGHISLVDAMRERGDLDWDGDEGKTPEPSKPLSELSESEAVKVVKETFTDVQLNEFKKTETRSRVLKAIDDQQKPAAEAMKKAKESGKAVNDIMEKQS